MSPFFTLDVSAEVIRAACDGDAKAHEEIFRACRRPVYTLIRRLIPRATVADDVFQDTFVELLRNKPDLPHVHRYLAASYAKLDRMSEARRHAERVRAHQPNFSAKAWSNVVPHMNRDAAEEYASFLAKAGL